MIPLRESSSQYVHDWCHGPLGSASSAQARGSVFPCVPCRWCRRRQSAQLGLHRCASVPVILKAPLPEHACFEMSVVDDCCFVRRFVALTLVFWNLMASLGGSHLLRAFVSLTKQHLVQHHFVFSPFTCCSLPVDLTLATRLTMDLYHLWKANKKN